MRPVGDNLPAVIRSPFHGTLRRHGLEKLRPASGLSDHSQDFSQSRNEPDHNRPHAALSRSGMEPAVPFRYRPEAPRLDAAFVAQLLGQMMPGREADRRSARAAYGGMRATAPLFDTRL